MFGRFCRCQILSAQLIYGSFQIQKYEIANHPRGQVFPDIMEASPDFIHSYTFDINSSSPGNICRHIAVISSSNRQYFQYLWPYSFASFVRNFVNPYRLVPKGHLMVLPRLQTNFDRVDSSLNNNYHKDSNCSSFEFKRAATFISARGGPALTMQHLSILTNLMEHFPDQHLFTSGDCPPYSNNHTNFKDYFSFRSLVETASQ